MQKTHEEEEIALDPSLVLALYFLIFSSFGVIQNVMGAPTKALQNFLISRKQRCNDQRF
jgi:hypothetical protein